MSWTGRQFGTHQTLALTCRQSMDSHMHKSKQLADCDSTPSANKITMYVKAILFLRRFSYLLNKDN